MSLCCSKPHIFAIASLTGSIFMLILMILGLHIEVINKWNIEVPSPLTSANIIQNSLLLWRSYPVTDIILLIEIKK